MFQRIFNTSSRPIQFSHISTLDNIYKDTEMFYKKIESWKAIQINYVTKMTELCQSIKYNSKSFAFQFHQIVKIVMHSHSKLLNKIDLDIFAINKQSSNDLMKKLKVNIQNEKQLCRDFTANKQLLQKTLLKKDKLMRSLQQQMMAQVFMEDSVEGTMQKRIRSFSKSKEIELELEGYQIKVDQILHNLQVVNEKSNSNIIQTNQSLELLTKNRFQTVNKITNHIYNEYKTLVDQIKEIGTKNLLNVNNTDKIEKINKNGHQFQYEQKCPIFLHTTLKQIHNKSLDEILQYWKNNEIKGKIKRILQNKQLGPEQTDQLAREVKSFQKLIKNNKDSQALKCFLNFINKNIKYRINFIFILQTYRLMNQFQINQEASRGVIIMIQQVIACCQKFNDTFCLKNIMAILSTYYVTIKDQKIYLLQFFKDNNVWKCMQFWQATLIESIYVEKKKTVHQYMTNSDNRSKKDILNTQSMAIASQVIYIVKNMVLFGFTQRQVKNFAFKFSKKLNQDDKSLKDVYVNLEQLRKQFKTLFQKKKKKHQKLRNNWQMDIKVKSFMQNDKSVIQILKFLYYFFNHKSVKNCNHMFGQYEQGESIEVTAKNTLAKFSQDHIFEHWNQKNNRISGVMFRKFQDKKMPNKIGKSKSANKIYTNSKKSRSTLITKKICFQEKIVKPEKGKSSIKQYKDNKENTKSNDKIRGFYTLMKKVSQKEQQFGDSFINNWLQNRFKKDSIEGFVQRLKQNHIIDTKRF